MSKEPVTNASVRGSERSFDVLLIDSDPDDISPLIDSFEATEYTDHVHAVSNGDEALDFIHQRNDYADAPRPDLILLDLHVSDDGGGEILSELNERPELRRIPVLVVTSSAEAEDIAQSYRLNANAYLTKPDTPDGFEDLARAIEGFWLRLVHMPPK